jgi:hypothetical protein
LKDPLRIPPLAAGVTAPADNPLPPLYPIGLADRKKLPGKVSLIIVNDSVTMAKTTADKGGSDGSERANLDFSGHIAATVRPTDVQRRYLERWLSEPGGKLLLFDAGGREVPRRTI